MYGTGSVVVLLNITVILVVCVQYRYCFVCLRYRIFCGDYVRYSYCCGLAYNTGIFVVCVQYRYFYDVCVGYRCYCGLCVHYCYWCGP